MNGHVPDVYQLAVFHILLDIHVSWEGGHYHPGPTRTQSTICALANIRDTSADQNKFISLIFRHYFIQFEGNCSLTFRCCDKSAEISERCVSISKDIFAKDIFAKELFWTSAIWMGRE